MAFEPGNLFGYQFEPQPTPFDFGIPPSGTEILNESEKQPTDDLFAFLREDRAPLHEYSEHWQNDPPQNLVGVTTSLGPSQLNTIPQTYNTAASVASDIMANPVNPLPRDLEDGFGNYQLHTEYLPAQSPQAVSPQQHAPPSLSDLAGPFTFISSTHALHQPTIPLSLSGAQGHAPLLSQHQPQQQNCSLLGQHRDIIDAANSLTSMNSSFSMYHPQFSPSHPQLSPSHPQLSPSHPQLSPSHIAPHSGIPTADYSAPWADMAAVHATPPTSQRPAKRHFNEHLLFGSDEQFDRNAHFLPQHSSETSQALSDRRGNIIQHALQRIPSTSTTRQPSPIPNMSVGNTISPSHTNRFMGSQPPSPLSISIAENDDDPDYPSKRLKTPPIPIRDAGSQQGGVSQQVPSATRGKAAAKSRAPRSRNKPSRPKRAPLTQEQKRKNHNDSERKRRDHISKGFEELRIARPGVNALADSKADVIHATVKWVKTMADNNKYLEKLAENQACAEKPDCA